MVHGPLLARADGKVGAGLQQIRNERLREPDRLHGARALGKLRCYGRRQRAPRAVCVARAAQTIKRDIAHGRTQQRCGALL